MNSLQSKQKTNWVAIIAMFFLFAMIAFVTNLAAPVGTIWKSNYEWSGMLGNMMNFLAYLFMGIPAGSLLVKIGYKKTALAAMAVGFIGLGLQYVSSLFGGDIEMFTVSGQPVMLNLIIYLLGAFVCGFCACMLNTVVNPMLNMLGRGGNKGNQLIQIGGSFNSLTGTVTPFFVGMLVGQVTEKTSMTDVVSLLWVAMGVFIASFIIISFVNVPEPKQAEKTSAKGKDKYGPMSFRHTLLGVIGIFFYVGLEVGIPGVLIMFLSNPEASGITENGLAIATSVAAVYWLLMLVGRIASSFVSKWVSSRTQLITVSSVAIMLVVLAIVMPADIKVSMFGYSAAEGFTSAQVPISALLLVLCGLCTSVMWGGIFNLAVEGIGKYTAKASGIFMTMVVGGGVMPLIQEWLAGVIGYMASYWLVAAMLGYLLYYGLIGSRNVNKNIPVDD